MRAEAPSLFDDAVRQPGPLEQHEGKGAVAAVPGGIARRRVKRIVERLKVARIHEPAAKVPVGPIKDIPSQEHDALSPPVTDALILNSGDGRCAAAGIGQHAPTAIFASIRALNALSSIPPPFAGLPAVSARHVGFLTNAGPFPPVMPPKNSQQIAIINYNI